jgi:hypothetical protein
MAKTSIELPSKLDKTCWFYEGNEKLIDPHLGKYYISYSTISSWEDYRGDFIKQKLAGIKLPDSIYATFGSWVGESVEHGKEQPNNYGFTGAENLNLIARTKNDKYERMILIDMGEYVIIGFIDIMTEVSPMVAQVADIKTGGAKKEEEYKKETYIQTTLYSHALEREGYKIDKSGVWFCRRTGSHVKPPLNLSNEQFYIPLDYNEKRVKYALDKTDRVVREISEYLKVYNKFFVN